MSECVDTSFSCQLAGPKNLKEIETLNNRKGHIIVDLGPYCVELAQNIM